MSSIVDFKEHFPTGNNDRPVSQTDNDVFNSDFLFSKKYSYLYISV